MSARTGLVAALTRDHALSRNLILLAGLAGTVAALAAAGHHPAALWALMVTLPVLVLSLIDLFQTQHSLRRN